MGFIKQEEYVQKREEQKAELTQLQPIPQDELIEAHRTLAEFPNKWGEADAEGRQRLLNKILQRVWVCDDHLFALIPRPSYYVLVHQAIADGAVKDTNPGQLPPFLQKENGNFRFMESYRCGSDGCRSISGSFNFVVLLITATC